MNRGYEQWRSQGPKDGSFQNGGQWREIRIMESAHGNAAPHCTAASLGEALKVLSRSGVTLWVSSLLDPAGRSDGGAAGKKKGSGSEEGSLCK